MSDAAKPTPPPPPAPPAAAKPPASSGAKPAAPQVPPTDAHYSVPKLNWVFLLSTAACLGAFGLMVMQDWDRDWKGYQKNFQAVLKRRALADKAAEEKMVNDSARKKLAGEMDAAEATVKSRQAELDAALREFAAAKTQSDVLERGYQDNKAELDASRYAYEAVVAEKGVEHAGTAKVKFDKWFRATAAADELNKAQKAKVAALDEKVRALRKPVADAEADTARVRGKLDRLEAGIKKLSPKPFDNAVSFIRNLPLLDFAAPPYEVKQSLQNDFRQDLNFQTVGTVDRCQTCHLAIDRPGFEHALDAEGKVVKGKDGKPVPMAQPFRTHSNLELYLGSSSPHKLEEFGCTSCHGGRDRGLDFVSAAHTPRDEDQAARWKRDYKWEPMGKWDLPMLPLQSTGAKCAQCHAQQTTLVNRANGQAVGNNWTRGRELFEKFGCWGCHKTAGYEGIRKVGPDLTRLAGKLDKNWVLKWVDDPFSFRANTRMPAFFHQPNNGGPELEGDELARAEGAAAAVAAGRPVGEADEFLRRRFLEQRRTHAELTAIVEYLYANSTAVAPPAPARSAGSAENGKKLFYKLGCAGCHTVAVDERAAGRDAGRGAYGRNFGPSLDGVGSKAGWNWIYDWVKNPRNYWPETRMPDLRLSDDEAADLTAWLVTLKHPGFEGKPPVARDNDAIAEQLAEYFKGKGLTGDDARAKVAALGENDRALMLGEKMLGRYGCYGCHAIKGFENAQGIGVELYGASNEGNKAPHLLDFGFLADEHYAIPPLGADGRARTVTGDNQAPDEEYWVEVPESFPLYERDGKTPVKAVRRVNLALRDWVKQKLLEPRIWDLGRDRGVEDRTKMPNFHFSPDEAEALATVVLGFTKPMVAANRVMVPQGGDALAEKARRYIKDRNCAGCHLYNGEGGAIRKTFNPDDDPEYNLKWPPSLTGEGAKVQTDWIRGFLSGPTPIRPKVEVRMPTFHFSADELNTVIAGWNAESKQSFPFADDYSPESHADDVALGRVIFESGQCKSCHALNAADLKREGVKAPDLELSRRRLKPEWINAWLRNPQRIAQDKDVAMPVFDYRHVQGLPEAGAAEETARIEAVKAYVMSLGK